MKRKKVKNLAFLMAAAMTASTFLSTEIPVQAADNGEWIIDEALEDNSTEEPEPDTVLPDANQYKYQKDELAAFCHFGPNTWSGYEWGFNQGSQTWLYEGIDPVDLFPLEEQFDADTLVKTLHDAGFKKLIVTAKHHDGFCIWNSDYTEYDVESTNYGGDVLAEISAACTDYNMDMGLYLSPWDVAEESYGYGDGDRDNYNTYYNNQLEEILSAPQYGNNGHFVEVWMDGANGYTNNPQEYDFERWFDTIQKWEGKAAGNEADCMLFGAQAYTTVRWIGNENGTAAKDTWSKSMVDKTLNTINSNSQGGHTIGLENGNQWTVPEADARITSGWFWSPSKNVPKTLEQLGNMYFNSVGHNATLLLNVPPNTDGTVDKAILDRVAEFGKNIKETFDDNMASADGAVVKASDVRGSDIAFKPGNTVDGNDETYWTTNDNTNEGSLLIDLGSSKKIDVISIEEAIQNGQRINEYRVEYRNGSGDWILLEEGQTIGAKRLVRVPAVTATQVKITVTTPEDKVPMISEVGVYKATEEFELAAAAPAGMEVISVKDKDPSDGQGFTFTGGWTVQTGSEYVNETNTWANQGASFTLKFNGTKVYLVGTKDPNHGKATIQIDDGDPVEVDTRADTRSTGQVWFSSEDLPDGPHTLTLNVASSAIGIEAAYVINNGGVGMVGLETDEYTVSEDSILNVKVKRVGGTTGRIKAMLSPNPGTAIQGDFDTEPVIVTIPNGESEVTVPVVINRNEQTTGDRAFTVELNSPSSGLIIGFIDMATVNIVDAESMTKEQLQTLYDSVKDWEESLYSGDWDTFAAARAAAQALLEESAPDALEMSQAYSTLNDAMRGLAERTEFTADDPVVLPTGKGETVTAEAEFLACDSSGAESGKHIRVVESENDSNGRHLGWFENGNVVTMHYYAPKAGTYNVTVTFASGRPEGNKNNITFANSDGTTVVEEFRQTTSNDWGTEWQTREFALTVNTPGAGELVMTTTNGGPNLDKFEITPAEGTWTYDVAATAGEGGTISPEGVTIVDQNGSKEYTITPNDGYVIGQVLVGGVDVTGNVTIDENGAGTYVVSDVTEDTTISVDFEFVNYTESTRFEFPSETGKTATLEAEYLILDSSQAAQGKEIRVSTSKADSSNGKCLDYFENGNTASICYYAEKTGTYTVTLRFASGRPESDQNNLTFTEQSGYITEVTQHFNQTAQNDWGTVWQEREFEFEVTTPGKGVIELTTTNAGPILDKFDIVLTEETGALADEIYKVDLEIALQNAAKELALTDVYTEDSVAALAEAQSAAQAVFDDDTATQAEVDEKLEALENAMEGLEYPTFNITTSVEANTGGTITSSADSVERGESVNFTITPAYGYIAKKLTVNGNEVASDSSETTTFYGPNRTYSISNITEDQEVSVTFEKTGYTEEEPFEFPTGTEPVTLEAEDFTLYNAGQLSEKWKLSVSSATWDNQTVQFINCLNSGDSISVPYRAEAGTYDVTAYYRSGSDSNQLIWSSEGDKITAGSANAGSADKNSSVTRNTTFTVTVAEGGAGVWTFTAPSGNSPQLDRLVITKQGTPEPQTYTVTARVEGGNGTITPESREVNAGESVEFTITPNEGYEIADVQVDSTSVLGQVENGKYTLTDINANTEVVVSFKEIPAAPEQYTEENPFQFPTELNGTPVTLEAERFILNNTGTDEEWEIQVSDADWASNKQYVNAMNAGDSITLHYYAEKAGIYQATLQYRSGDTRNSMTWAEAEGKIENGSLPSVEQGDSTTAAVVLTWEVTTPGAGVLTFTAGEMNAPQLDKFDIRLIEETGTVTPVEYAITAEPAENGSVTVSAEKVAAGESVTYTAAAAEGYVIDSIEVNGAAVADVSGNVSYEGTIDNIQENIIIRATFKAAAATQPDKSVLEAELITSETILTQTDKYTEESLTAYNAAVTAARAVFDDPNATQEQINAAVQNLTDAANLLVENTTDPNPGTGEQDPSGTGEQELPGTGGQGSSGTGGQESSGTTALSDTQKPSGSSTGTVRAAQSGDEYSPILWIVVLAAECAAGGVVIRLRMKK